MSIRDSSRAAYRDLKDSGKLGNQCQKILQSMKAGSDYSLQEISRITGIAINAISGRCHSMKKLGVLIEAPTRRCSITGKTIHPVMIAIGVIQ